MRHVGYSVSVPGLDLQDLTSAASPSYGPNPARGYSLSLVGGGTQARAGAPINDHRVRLSFGVPSLSQQPDDHWSMSETTGAGWSGGPAVAPTLMVERELDSFGSIYAESYSLWSVDLFRCESILLKSYWTMVVMDVFTRRIIGFGIAPANLDGPVVCQMFNRAIAKQRPPRYLSSDHDPLFRFHRWLANLRVLGVDEIKAIPCTPVLMLSLSD
jgi:transposase InsO family protein